jgi:hypothetical protein
VVLHFELLSLVDLQSSCSVWISASVTMLTVDTVYLCYCICMCVQSKTVSEHNAVCELYSSHMETKILAMNVTYK